MISAEMEFKTEPFQAIYTFKSSFLTMARPLEKESAYG